MKKLFISNLPSNATEENIGSLFSRYGTVRSIDIIKDIFTGKCKGFGYIEMEGHEARAALSNLDGFSFENSILKVRYDEKSKHRSKRR